MGIDILVVVMENYDLKWYIGCYKVFELNILVVNFISLFGSCEYFGCSKIWEKYFILLLKQFFISIICMEANGIYDEKGR